MFLYSVGRKPGRPKVIPEATVPKVIALYKQGLGYRAIARELKKENLSVNWSTVRRLIKKELRCKPLRRCARCFNVVSPHSINKDRHAIAYCSKRFESAETTATGNFLDLCEYKEFLIMSYQSGISGNTT